jgi:sterol desaturase/sphingolipid hydroxylase (fatty acid hydroxylase superfamily)
MWQFLYDFLCARIGVILLLFVLCYWVERLAPAEPARSFPNVILNCLCGFFFLAGDALATLLVASLFVRFSWHGLFAVFPADRGILAIAIALSLIWLVMKDFFYYWFHRLQHTSRWLWMEHMLHHTDEHLNVTTSVRHHWLEMPLYAVCVAAPLLLLFHPPLITIPIASVLTNLLDYFIHSNAKLGFGRLSWLLTSPQNHRIHHSKLPEHRDKNFAVVTPLWDVLFGTYYHPGKDEYPPTGLSSGEKVESLRRALILPFPKWYRMIFPRNKASGLKKI